MFLALEGYNLAPPTGYIIRELTVICDNDDYQHFHFRAPDNFHPTDKEKRTIKYTTTHLNQLYINDTALLPYSTLNYILKNLSSNTIYVAGQCAYNFIKSKIEFSNVIDICMDYNFTYPKTLPKSNCFKDHNPRYCSLSKCKYIKNFMINEWAMNQ